MNNYEYSHYFGSTEMWAASAEYTPTPSQSTPQSETLEEAKPAPVGKLIVLGIVLAPSFASLGTLTWGTLKVAEGASQLQHTLIPMQLSN